MNLEARMRQSISRRAGSVVLRSDVVGLGSPTQVSHILDSLINKGFIFRLGRGIYAKANILQDSSSKLPDTLSVVITDIASKLGFSLAAAPKLDEQDVKVGQTIVIETNSNRVSRSICINGIKIIFRSSCKKTRRYDTNRPVQFPTKNVAQYIEALANANKVKYNHCSMDRWASAVTRLAGDDVRQDKVEDMLVALKRAGKISTKDVAALTINYLRERKQSVRPV